MKFLLAPDSFKESMSAKKAITAMEKGIRQVFPNAECIHVPMADGGEGTLEALVDGSNGVVLQKEVVGPLGKKVMAQYGISGDGKTAFIEMASASGIHLVPHEERNPLMTTSFGTGELIRSALDHGVEKIIIGIGGSATNDGGVGMLQALGISFLDHNNVELPFGGGNLHHLVKIDGKNLDKRLNHVQIDVACDVTNPLIGKTGASYIFGPQKGADERMVKILDDNLTHYAEKIFEHTGKEVQYVPGAGAAGGLGAAFIAFLNANLKRGVDLVIDFTDLKKKMAGVDYVLTGEGSIDGQTLFGKTPYGVAKTAEELGIPVIAFAGKVGKDVHFLYEHGFTAIFGILKEVSSLPYALEKGEENLAFSVENFCRVLKKKNK